MRRVLAIIPCVMLAGIALSANLAVPAEFRTVVSDATLIVRGQITDVRAVSVPGAGIDSVATLAVESVLKGQAGAFVYVRVPGGVIGRTRFVMTGAPTFRRGERAVLFLKPGVTDTAYRPIGLTMGVYPIVPEPISKQLVVEPPVIAGRSAGAQGQTIRGDKGRKPLTVGEFESLVRLVLATPPGRAIPRGGGR